MRQRQNKRAQSARKKRQISLVISYKARGKPQYVDLITPQKGADYSLNLMLLYWMLVLLVNTNYRVFYSSV